MLREPQQVLRACDGSADVFSDIQSRIRKIAFDEAFGGTRLAGCFAAAPALTGGDDGAIQDDIRKAQMSALGQLVAHADRFLEGELLWSGDHNQAREVRSQGRLHALDDVSPFGDKGLGDLCRPAKGLRQHPVPTGGNVEKIEKSRKMLRHLEETQRVSEWRGVYDDRSVFFARQRTVNGQKRRHLRHAGQSGIEQRPDLLTGEDGPAFEDGEDGVAVFTKKSAKFALRVDLPHPNLLVGCEGQCPRYVAELRLKDVGEGMRRVGGDQQNRLFAVFRSGMQRESRSESGLAHSSFADKEREFDHAQQLYSARRG